MTREDITKECRSIFSTSKILKDAELMTILLLIDICDDFESRTCSNCKHLKGLKPKLGQTYCNLSIEDLNYDMGVKLDFGCNKFERLENE